MKYPNWITGILTIFFGFMLYIYNINFLDSFLFLGIIWMVLTGLLEIYFIFALKLLRSLHPGKLVLSFAWIGLIFQIFNFAILLLTFGTSDGIMIVTILSNIQIPLIIISSGAVCGRQNRSVGAFFAVLSLIFWITSYFIITILFLSITISLLGFFMLYRPIEVKWITKLRPSDKIIKISIVIEVVIFLTIPIPILWILNNHPQFITANWIELDKIYRISRFRSQAGHNFPDLYESGRSLKHYFQPFDKYGFTDHNVSIFSPVDGILTNAYLETRSKPGNKDGWHLVIQPLITTIYSIHLFHVNINSNIFTGMILHAGQKLGEAHLIGDPEIQTNTSDTDIAVEYFIPIFGLKRISFFDVITDDVFDLYKQRSIISRNEMIIPKEVADAYTGWIPDVDRDWFILSPP